MVHRRRWEGKPDAGIRPALLVFLDWTRIALLPMFIEKWPAA
jgi:hypothetical protein